MSFSLRGRLQERGPTGPYLVIICAEWRHANCGQLTARPGIHNRDIPDCAGSELNEVISSVLVYPNKQAFSLGGTPASAALGAGPGDNEDGARREGCILLPAGSHLCPAS